MEASGTAQVPVVVREIDAETERLDLALVANMTRVDLDPVEEARAIQRLIESGLTRKGRTEALDPAEIRRGVELWRKAGESLTTERL